MAASKDEPSHADQNGDQAPAKDEREYDRFKALTEKLVRVPKTELDEKLKQKRKG